MGVISSSAAFWCGRCLDPVAAFALYLEPGGILAWVIVGLVAGWPAGKVMKGEGYGFVTDLVVGLLGAVVGGFVFGLVFSDTYGLLGSIAVAFIGSCLLIALVRFIAAKNTNL
jgi:uncharacterized membrane protein YeaQ/YmgE (transglycosylase-associated protein family)